ncbi:hypothetical protein B0H14DRAFT_2622789 [Mycena olivaceomarginata]|nr:hypothetical protein B0H14DRAFT_2622789 [Mycena olivaceomarginata]
MLEELLAQAILCLEHVNDPLLESKLHKAAGDHFYTCRLDSAQAMQFYQKALGLAKLCGDSDQCCNVLQSMALLKWGNGNYLSAQLYVTESERLSKLATNLYQAAKGLWTGAMCSMSLGNFQQSIDQLQRGRDIIGICGLVGGTLDPVISVRQINPAPKSP